MTPRYKLRTLLILLAVLPPLLWLGWTKYEAWRAEQDRRRAEVAAAQQQILLRVGRPTAAQRAANLKVRIATLEAELAAQNAAREADDPRRVQRLQQQGYLPTDAAPRIQPQPKAPAKAGE
jgi:predicted negative regulator of RcsB-dependent stress response